MVQAAFEADARMVRNGAHVLKEWIGCRHHGRRSAQPLNQLASSMLLASSGACVFPLLLDGGFIRLRRLGGCGGQPLPRKRFQVAGAQEAALVE